MPYDTGMLSTDYKTNTWEIYKGKIEQGISDHEK